MTESDPVISHFKMLTLHKEILGHFRCDRMVVGQLHVPMQSVPKTTNVVSSNPAHGCTRYNVM
jgi:hypothetical protein